MWGGTPAKSTYCDLSSFGPALFEICWPDIYLGGPNGPVKDEMYWSGGLKSVPGQCLCRGLDLGIRKSKSRPTDTACFAFVLECSNIIAYFQTSNIGHRIQGEITSHGCHIDGENESLQNRVDCCIYFYNDCKS